MLTKSQNLAIIISVIAVLVIADIMLSCYMFSTFNVFRSSYALCKTLTDSSSVTELKDGVYMVGSGVGFDEFLSDMGYTEDKSAQKGGLHTVTKDGEQTIAAVTYSTSSYMVIEFNK